MKKIIIILFISICSLNITNASAAIGDSSSSSSSSSSSTNSDSSSSSSSSDNNSDNNSDDWWCIKLNTDFPGVGRCINPTDASDAFGWLMWWLMKLVINITIAIAFISLIAAGVMLSTWWISQWTAWKWKELLKKVVLWIALLGLSWIILHTINPNFFKTEISLQLIQKINP